MIIHKGKTIGLQRFGNFSVRFGFRLLDLGSIFFGSVRFYCILQVLPKFTVFSISLEVLILIDQKDFICHKLFIIHVVCIRNRHFLFLKLNRKIINWSLKKWEKNINPIMTRTSLINRYGYLSLNVQWSTKRNILFIY